MFIGIENLASGTSLSVVVKVDFKVMCLFLLTIKCPS